MTRKDYIAAAAALRAAAVSEERRTLAAAILADVFTADNPLFNRARFLEACGVGEGVQS